MAMTRRGTSMMCAVLAMFGASTSGCASASASDGVAEIQEPTTVVEVPTADVSDRNASVRARARARGLEPNETFPLGLNYATEPPADMLRARSVSKATPASDAEARALAIELANEVMKRPPKLKAIGPTVVMHVREGDRIDLVAHDAGAPGTCSGAFAIAGPGVTELDVKMFLDPTALVPPGSPLPSTLPEIPIIEDHDTGPIAAIGFDDCAKNPLPLPIPFTAAALATKGDGLIALQLFTSRQESPARP